MAKPQMLPYGRVILWCVIAILCATGILTLDIPRTDRSIFWSAVGVIGTAGVALVYAIVMHAGSRQ
jgi:hypothetical protein